MAATWSVGDKVLAQWYPEVYFYPASIKVRDEDRYHVRFDDGDQAWVTARQLAPLDITVGSRVFARWKGGPIYYPGEVDQQQGSKIHIAYDDGDEEWTTVAMIRVERGAKAAPARPALRRIDYGRNIEHMRLNLPQPRSVLGRFFGRWWGAVAAADLVSPLTWGDDRLMGFWPVQKKLLRLGRVVWSARIQANYQLYMPGLQSLPGEVITSFDPALDDDPLSRYSVRMNS